MLLILTLPTSQCNSPVFVGYYEGNPVNIMESIVQAMNGLPKDNTELTLDSLKMEDVSIYPVAAWHIMRLQVSEPEGQTLLDDDPTYGITADLKVSYEDGTESILQWSWWRFGIVRCPLVVNYGDGPLGTLRVLDVRMPGTPPAVEE